LAKSIWFWAKQHKIWLTASHIAGKDNITADIQSRKIFKHICSVCGTPDIDLFASRLNTQLEKFCAWKPDPDASFIDAFSIDWSEYKCYMFPPFSLLGRCVKKVQYDKTTAILVAPLWPTQAWFSQTMQMLIDTPIMVQTRDNLLSLPYKETVHPLRKTMNLMICQISGNSLLVKEYLLKQPISCCARGDKVLKNSTKYLSKDGFSTVAKGRLVKFRFL
jgi:hypothetical protein